MIMSTIDATALLESLPVPLLIAQLTGEIVYANSAIATLTQHLSQDLIGMNVSSLMPSSQADNALFDSQVSENQGCAVTYCNIGLLQRDGGIQHVSASVVDHVVNDAIYLVMTCHELQSVQETAESVLDRREAYHAEQLRVSDSRFKALFDHALEAMALLTCDGDVLEINFAAQNLIAGPSEGLKFWELDWWPLASECHRLQNSETLKETVYQVKRGARVRSPVLLETTEGDLEIDFSLIPVVNDGKVNYIIAEGRDITSF